MDWKSKRQIVISHSTSEAEYIAADWSTRMITCFFLLLNYLKNEQTKAIIIHEDNKACMVLARDDGMFLTSKSTLV